MYSKSQSLLCDTYVHLMFSYTNMQLILFILFTFGVLISIWWYLNLLKWNKYLKKYPGPYPLPILGNAHYFKTSADIVPVLMEFQKKFGGVVKIMLGDKPRLIITDPASTEFLLSSTSTLKKSYEYKYFHSWLGTGLLTSSGPKWRRQRKLITPTFHYQILEQFIETFNSQSAVLVEKLRKNAGGNHFDIFPYVSLCALDIICEAAMGTHVNAQNNSDSEYVCSVKEICSIVVDRVLSAVKMWDSLYIFSEDYRKEKRALKVLHGYTNSVIVQRRQELENHNKLTQRNEDDDTIGIKRRLAFLDLLLQCTVDGKPIPNEIIREEVDTFMFEGHDTTTSGISFTLYALSHNPEVQEKAVEELRKIFADDKARPATYQDLQDMKYLEMVIKESLRLYPSVPVYARILEEDVTFNGGVLPAGLSLTIFAYGLHREPKLFPDPEKFDPERFSSENVRERSPFAYLPFSAGPRNCIGQKFAMLEMKSTISKVLKHFEMLPVIDHRPVLLVEAIMKSGNGLPVYLRERSF